jgi:hypothetical protein
MTIRPDDGTNVFTVAVYILQTDPAKKYPSGLQSHPLFEVFGHPADKPPSFSSGTPVPQFKQSATLTLACPGQVPAGNTISVSGGLISTSAQAKGQLVPAGPGSGITIHYVGPHGTIDDHTVTSSSGGTYGDGETTTSADTGTWGIQASWDGNDAYGPARSAQCLVRVVSPPPPNTTPSTVKLVCPSGTVQYGQTSTVTGSIVPSRPGVQVHITYVPADPAESEVDRSATTTSSSSFSDSVVLGGGDWSVQAYWNGDAQTQGATSASCEVFVQPRIG